MARTPRNQPTSSISTITDPVTGRSFSRDTAVQGSTYKESPNTGAPAVSTDALKSSGTPTVPPPTRPDTASALVSSVRSTLPQTKVIDDAQREIDRGYKRYDDTLARLGERGQRRQQLMDQYGVTKDTQRLKDLNLSIAQRSSEFDQLESGLEGQGRGISLGIITSQQGAVRRQKASEIGAMASLAQAVQGNITLSKQLADSAVENEFAGIEQDIERTKLFIQRNRDRMTEAQRERSEELTLRLQDYENEVATKKQDRKDILAYAAEVAQQGFPQIAQQIMRTQDIDTAFTLASPYIGRMERLNAQSIMAERGRGGRPTRLSEAERKAQNLSLYGQAFQQGARLDDGTPVLDTNGFVTPLAWREALREAPSRGLSRQDLIKEYGYLLFTDENGEVASAYGLTAQERKMISGN